MNNKREKIETLKAALQKGEEKLRRAEREVKLLEEKRKAMTRNGRTGCARRVPCWTASF